MPYLLCIGFQARYVAILRKVIPDHMNLLIMEEPSLLPTAGANSRIEFIHGKYQQTTVTEDLLSLLSSYDIRGVVPLREYAVPVANQVACALELPKIGNLASICLRDKLTLRSTMQNQKLDVIRQPKFEKISKLRELEDFFDRNGPTIIKPSNRQSTVGVFRIQNRNDIAELYWKSVNAVELGRTANDRPLVWTYQAEELVLGSEYSTEAFVQNGQVIFHNGTQKITSTGNCPFEIGHILPMSLLNQAVERLLNQATTELVEVLKIENGTLHAEWMITPDGEIYLIEAAGRAPGCFITDLIENSYKFSYFDAWQAVLTGRQVKNFGVTPTQISAMRWLNPQNGIVTAVDVSKLSSGANGISILSHNIAVKPGDQVSIVNNQTRVGHIICMASPSQFCLENLMSLADGIIHTEVQPQAIE